MAASVASHVAIDSAGNVHRGRRLHRRDLQDRTDPACVAVLSTFMKDELPTVNISRVSQVGGTTRAAALACLSAWSTGRFAVVTSVTVLFCDVLLESRRAGKPTNQRGTS